MAYIQLKTHGMQCSSCEMLIEDALVELDGMHKIRADRKKGLVEVEFDESKVDAKKIKSIIEKEGYQVE